ncbi:MULTISPECIES: hypothetical protein [unclassified Methylophaga]|uniref:hypothetical protein n=1 Tax=unclassified Methylophaga TaxID=2629249 RepID=UPI000C8A8218|nr:MULTISPECIES: hypothetical protein [unclassified Methylophaga]MBN46322.1 hypothetical protein [Methylophaga sp.]|tara:strand:+ start:63703 stop:64038 length:336 start_codon:yes stop_codon:yes gene_type:complete
MTQSMNIEIPNECNVLAELKNTLSELHKYIPQGDIYVEFGLWKYSHNEAPNIQFTLSLCDRTTQPQWAFAEADSVDGLKFASKELLKEAGITTVEQYIRLKKWSETNGGAV